MSRALRILGSLLIAALALLPTRAQEPQAGAARSARITYLTPSSAYVDAGTEEGVREGDAIEVIRDGQTIANLKVTYVSTHRSSCVIVSSTVPLAVGDTVRFVPAEGPAPAAAAGSPVPATPTRKGGPGIHGRAGVRYLSTRDRTGNGGGYSSPALDFRLDGTALGGSPVDVAVDVRARRTRTDLAGGGSVDDSSNRVYRLAASYRLSPSQKIAFGRQYAPSVAALSLFDGLLWAIDGETWGGGVLAGVEPGLDLSYSNDVQEYGAYLVAHNRPGTRRRWTVSTGLVGSYTEGSVNREFLYLQGQYAGERLWTFLTQEFDYNRDWKSSEAGEDTFSDTATFLSLHLRAAKWLTLFGGYDNRRNVRLYRDRTTPETEFDDSFRRGTWGGASLRFGNHVVAGGEARESTGGPSGLANSWSLYGGAEHFTRIDLGFRVRGTDYSNYSSKGNLYSLTADMTFGSRTHLGLSGGTIEDTNVVNPELSSDRNWYAVDVEVDLGRQWYFILSAERNDGSVEKYDQLYTGASYRF